MENVKTHAEKRAEARKSAADFKFNKPGISHVQKDIVKFIWKLNEIDLRTVSEKTALLIAKDQHCKVLALTKKGEEKISGQKPPPAKTA